MSILWIYFIIFAVLGVFVFLYAFRSLTPDRDVEQRLMELQAMAEDEEA